MVILPDDRRFKDVTHVLIDPSCSGSGVVNTYRAGSAPLTGDDENAEREPQEATNVEQLMRNQLGIILHAMKLPNVSTVAYSTCSVHREENECMHREEGARGERGL